MKRYLMATGLATLLAAWTTTVLAIDSVRTRKQGTVQGTITEISPLEMKIDVRGSETVVSVNDILATKFDGEPSDVTKARTLIKNGEFAAGGKLLEAVDRSTITRREIVQEADFLAAYSTCQLALTGKATIKDAGNQMLAFLKNNPTSYHFLEGNELVGDLYVMTGLYDKAIESFVIAAKAPWPDAEARLNMKQGQALLALNKAAEATAAFEKVMANPAAEATPYKPAAQVGKANALAAGGKPEEALKLVDAIVAKLDKADTELCADAYLAQGNCYRLSNKPKDARLAYLHVELLYFQHPSSHAEALYHLSKLWRQLGNTERGRKAAADLARLYPNSRWAKQP